MGESGRYLFAALVVAVIFSSASIAAASCGDGILEQNEECDPGGALYVDGDPQNAGCASGGDCFYESSCCKFNCQFVGNGATCFDGDPCSINDTCDQVGVCGGDPSAPGIACDDGLFCTVTDTCDGAGGCSGTGDPCTGGPECASACDDVVDDCVVPIGTPCGDSTDDDCTDPDTCDGGGGCLANHAAPGTASGTTCNDANECTADTCDGGGGCSNDATAPGSSCGNAGDTECSNPDSCDGAGTCVGNDEPGGTACGDASDDECTDPDTCDGAGSCVVNDEAAGTPAAALCTDANECTDDQCDGGGGCQNPALAPGTACGDPADTDCTDADTCDGAGVCEPNDAAGGTSSPTLCNDTNECTDDQCDGGGGCTNLSFTNGTPCGDPTDTECTDADTCDGAGTCDSNDEPAGLDAPGQCGDGNPCTDNVCDGGGGCDNPGSTVGTPCGDPGDTACSNPDGCDGFGACSLNDEPLGTPCDDGLTCTTVDECDTGQCFGTTPVDCSDGNPCTRDICNEPAANCTNPAEPEPVCSETGAAAFSVIDNKNDKKDKMKWKWFRGPEILFEDLGDPLNATNYYMCIYDFVGGTAQFEEMLTITPGPSWKAKSTKQLKYLDRDALSSGIQKIKIKVGPDGKPRASVKARGEHFPTPIPETSDMYFAVDPKLSVQFWNDAGMCLGSTFDTTFKNDGRKFKTVRRVLIN